MKNLFTLFTLILFVNQINAQLASGTFTGGSSALTPGANIASATLTSASIAASDCTADPNNAREMTGTNATTITIELMPSAGYAITQIVSLNITMQLSGGTCSGADVLTGTAIVKVDGVQPFVGKTVNTDCLHYAYGIDEAAPAPMAANLISSSASLSAYGATVIEIVVYDFSCVDTKTLNFDNIEIFGFTSALLPVDLTKFDAKKTQKSIMLSWATASEKNNDHFDIQKSTNGSDFQTIGQVKGNGTTATGANYNFEDNTPSVGVAYYRLKQVDADDKFVFSQVRSIRFGNNKLVVAPTLAKESISITVSDDENINYEIINLNGQKILAGKAIGQQTIDVSGLNSGLYFIHTEGGNVSRFIKQ